jgi:lipopolysaccharide transport system ATP-binding protein
MSSNDIAIHVTNLSKCYEIYDTPRDRLKQFIMPRVRRIASKAHKQYFREFWALKDVSFEVKKGETVGIIGRNGSGKSTLLQMICGTLTPTSGSIRTNGRIAALLELGSGFNPEFTGRENVYMNASVLGLGKEEIDARFDDIAAFADIGDFIDQPVKSYSSGMVVRLAFAVAINVDPEILIVDEALSVGDELFQRKCFSRIESIKNSGSTILFVSHSATIVVELCDRAVLLDGGELLSFGSPKLIVAKYQKLLYAPLYKREEILEEIRLITQDKYQEDSHEVVEVSVNDNHEQEHADDPEEFFDSHLVSKSMVEFESHGVLISKPKIEDLQGRQINNLVRNRKYKYSYKVKFDRPASHVRFGMLVKTTSGFPLGGALSATSLIKAIPFIEAGSTVLVEFSFNCNLNPGLYFLNAGVFGSIEQEETVLHRIVDAVAFHVLPVEHNLVTEIVDFGFVPEVTINA